GPAAETDGEPQRAGRAGAPHRHTRLRPRLFSSLFGLYRGKPQNPVGDDGRMALADHFRELRARLLRAITVLVVAIIVALVFYDPIFEFVTSPYRDALGNINKNVTSSLYSGYIGGPLMIQLKLCTFVAIGAT